MSNISYRTLVACVKDFGIRPCHRCHVHRSDLHRIGERSDATVRECSARNPTIAAEDIRKARGYIYDENRAVDGNKVDSVLFENSLVPTVVSVHQRRCLAHASLSFYLRARFRDDWVDSISTFIRRSRSILCMRLSSAYGRICLSICYEFWTVKANNGSMSWIAG